jgi:outer membrane protein assembly factor BamD
MLVRFTAVVVLGLLLPGLIARAENGPASPDNPRSTIAPADAAKEMQIGRYYVSKRDYTAGLNRFKVVVTKFQASHHVEEALARLTEVYLALGISSEARTAAAVLARKFPTGQWTQDARAALQSAGLEPAEDERSWISRAFR